MIAALVALAISWWGQGVPPSCGVPSVTMIHEADPYAYGETQGCHIVLDRMWWKQLTPDDRCRLIFHEMGHVYGFAHTEMGIMQPILYSGSFAVCDDRYR